MRLKLDINLCRKLLDVIQHDRTSCTDEQRNNQYANSEGWVSCTRCWLLQAVEEDWVPEAEFELYATVKLAETKSPINIIDEYIKIVKEHGSCSTKAIRFFEINKNNREFAEMAKIVQNLKHEPR